MKIAESQSLLLPRLSLVVTEQIQAGTVLGPQPPPLKCSRLYENQGMLPQRKEVI